MARAKAVKKTETEKSTAMARKTSKKSKSKAAPKAARRNKASVSAEKPEGPFRMQATLRKVRISPLKLRLALELVRGKQVEPALQILRYSPRKGARFLEKLLKSAVANVREQSKFDVDRLWVVGGWVNHAQIQKRGMPAARGSMMPIKKRASHLTVVVGERG